MPNIIANGLTIEYDQWGPLDGPCVLLISGVGTQLTVWPEILCTDLAARGYRVVRFDNRDVGLSEKFDGQMVPPIPEMLAKRLAGEEVDAPYTLSDMASDAVGLLDSLGVKHAHMVGMSMGGMIAQMTAIEHPDRVLSLTSIMSTTGDPSLPMGTPEATAALFSVPDDPSDPESIIDNSVRAVTAIGSPGYPTPPEVLRANVSKRYARSYYPQGMIRQFAAVVATGSRAIDLPGVTTPTLVIHGRDDPLVPLLCGEHTAQLIPGARLEIIDGMGHDLPDQLMPRFAAAIDEHARAAM